MTTKYGPAIYNELGYQKDLQYGINNEEESLYKNEIEVDVKRRFFCQLLNHNDAINVLASINRTYYNIENSKKTIKI